MMEDSFWRKFFRIMFVVDLIGIGVWSYLTLRTREYQSYGSDSQPINFSLNQGWIVEIRTDQTVLLTAASPEYFYLQKFGSTDPQDVIAGKPSVRPVGYREEMYFLAEEKVQSSDWVVKQGSFPECQLEQLQETELHVKTYPQLYVVARTILAITSLVLLLSFLIAGFVWAIST